MPEATHVFCGNCVAVCPTSALKGTTEYYLERGLDYGQFRRERRKARKNQTGAEASGG
jgi:NADH dehydrogenase/NADH:ubiquinone oxidoreductase subunit G